MFPSSWPPHPYKVISAQPSTRAHFLLSRAPIGTEAKMQEGVRRVLQAAGGRRGRAGGDEDVWAGGVDVVVGRLHDKSGVEVTASTRAISSYKHNQNCIIQTDI